MVTKLLAVGLIPLLLEALPADCSGGNAPGGDDAGGPTADASVDSAVPDASTPETSTMDSSSDSAPTNPGPIKTVFLILMENHNWSDIKGSASAPYINGTLLPAGSHAENYFDTPTAVHPSLPNYLWLEAGDNFGVLDDSDPSVHHQATSQHLVSLLSSAGISWKSYQEDMTGGACPIASHGKYAPKHNPMVYFDDLVGNPPSTSSANCIAHVRPYAELATDLTNDTAAAYNFITPNLCNDMHDSVGCSSLDSVKNGDTWLSVEIPKLLASAAYKDNGAIFITWDESEGGEVPIGMIVLSPKAKGHGYSNTVKYFHSSMLRTVQEIFHVTPLLRDAANQSNLGDLFTSFP